MPLKFHQDDMHAREVFIYRLTYSGPPRGTLSLTTFSVSPVFFSSALVSACHACSELSTKLRSRNNSSSASGVPDVLTIISESSTESTLLTQAHVRKRCKKVTRFSRPRNSGTVEGMNIPMLVDGAGALSMSAAAAAAVTEPVRCMYSLSLARKSSWERLSFPSPFENSLLDSSIFLLLPQKFLAVEVPNSKVLQHLSLSVCRSPLSSTIRVGDGLHWSRRCFLMMQIVYTQKHSICYLSRVKMDDDRLIKKGEHTM